MDEIRDRTTLKQWQIKSLFAGIYVGQSSLRGFLGGAKWISSIHSSSIVFWRVFFLGHHLPPKQHMWRFSARFRFKPAKKADGSQKVLGSQDSPVIFFVCVVVFSPGWRSIWELLFFLLGARALGLSLCSFLPTRGLCTSVIGGCLK